MTGYKTSTHMRWMKLILVVQAALFAGCTPAVVVRPLYETKDKAPVDQRIEGEWVTPDVDNSRVKDKIYCRWTVGEYDSSDGYSVILRFLPADSDEVKEETETKYHVRLLPIGDKLFFDAEFQSEKFGAREIELHEMSIGVVSTHVVGRVWIEQDFLRIALLDSEWVMRNIPEGTWVRKYGGEETIAAITAPAEEVRALLVREADNRDAFNIALYFCRPGVSCAAKGAEDELARRPKDAQTIENTASLYLRQGNYARAVELRRHRVELDPKDFNKNEDLGSALMLNHDFEEARRQFVAAEQLKPANVVYSSLSWDLAWIYFLEGKYDEAVKASADYLSRKYPIPELILVNNVALLRLGRTTEAQSLLEKQVATFQGSWEDHLLLLEFQGRLFSSPRSTEMATSREFEFRRLFFVAMRWAAKGDKAKAAAALQEMVKTGNRESTLYLAAQIELERLGQPATH
jgi:tetratricopeptide (TPR) repeat protein